MHIVVQAVILGVLTGGLYALMASGLTLVFGIMRVINVAQGAFVILAAYLSYSLFGHLGLDPFLSILLLMPAMFVAGVLTQLVFVRSLRGEHASEMSLLVTWALGFGIGAATAAAAGALYGIVYPFNPGSHYDLISRLLSIIVLGGLGSVGGAVLAAMLLGITESVVAVEYSPTWASMSFFAILILVL